MIAQFPKLNSFRKGVALEMIQISMELARQEKCEYIAAIATSKPFQKLMVQKVGFDTFVSVAS